MQLHELVSNFAQQGGIDLPEDFKKVLPTLNQALPPELESFVGQLITVEQAKTNKAVHDYFDADKRQLYLTKAEKEFAESLKNAGLDEETLATLNDKSLKSKDKFEKGLAALKTKLQEASKADKGDVKDQIKEYVAKYEEALKSHGLEKETFANQLTEKDTQISRLQNELLYNEVLSGFELANPFNDLSISRSNAKMVIQNALAELKAQLVFENGKLEIRYIDTPQIAFQINNKPVQVQDFIKSVLEAKNMLKVHDDSNLNKDQRQIQGGDGTKKLTPAQQESLKNKQRYEQYKK